MLVTFYLRLDILYSLELGERNCKMQLKIRYNIAEKRHEQNMTQKQLAKKAGVSTAMISFIENNKRQPTLYVIASIAKALKVTLNELVIIKDPYQYFK